MTDLGRYFAGRAADPAAELMLQTVAAMRADAGFEQRSDDALGGAMLSDEAPAVLAPDALEAVQARIDRAQALDRAAADHAKTGGRAAEIAALPSPLREVAFAAVKRHRWRFGGFGIRRLPLTTGDGAFVELMRIEPGRGVPDHDHDDDEVTLVLTGAYFDGHDHYRPGDISLARPGFVHTPTADPGDICYVLAVSYGAPKLQGVYRLLQPFLAEPGDARAVWRTR